MSKDKRREKREMRARKAREKRRKARQKRYEQEVKKRKARQNGDDENSIGNKFFKFIDSVVSVFIPGHNHFAHDRLRKQGVMLVSCITLLISGGVISYRAQAKKDYIASQIQSFTTDSLEFSKTGTSVNAGKPFKTSDSKTVYVPLYINDTSNVPTNAKKYHIMLAPNSGNQFEYPILKTQLISYGSTGHLILKVTSSQKIASQMANVIIWSSDNLTQDSYDPSDDENKSSSAIIEAIKKRYDTLNFTINFGGSSIPSIGKYDVYYKTEKVKVRNKKTNKVETVTKKVKHYKLNPDNKYLYSQTNNDYLAFIYNRISTQKYVDTQKKRAKSTYNKLQIAINKLKDDHDKLTTSGYKVPAIPNWATSVANNMANGLPYLYENIQNVDYMKPFITDKRLQAMFNMALAEYQKDQDTNDQDDDSNNAIDHKATDYLNSLQDKTIKNIKLHKTIGASSSDNSTASSQWDDYTQQLQNIYNYKTTLYYKIPLHLYDHYQNFLETSSWGDDNSRLNSGSITFSNLNGKNNAGKYVIVLGNPLNNRK